MHNRGRTEIINAILTCVASNGNAGTRKTRIQTQSNLTSLQCNQFLSFLIDKRLVAMNVHRNVREYRITTKGIELMRIMSELDDMLKAGRGNVILARGA